MLRAEDGKSIHGSVGRPDVCGISVYQVALVNERCEVWDVEATLHIESRAVRRYEAPMGACARKPVSAVIFE